MQTQKRLVVILPRPMQIGKRKFEGVYTARLRELGLTAYGRTEQEAKVAVNKLFNEFVEEHQTRGNLETLLNRLPINWYWEDDYSDDWELKEDLSESRIQTLVTHGGQV